jgi:hypothetical protein
LHAGSAYPQAARIWAQVPGSIRRIAKEQTMDPSRNHLRPFAGSDPRRIHHLERDAEFLIALPGPQIAASMGQTGGDRA